MDNTLTFPWGLRRLKNPGNQRLKEASRLERKDQMVDGVQTRRESCVRKENEGPTVVLVSSNC